MTDDINDIPRHEISDYERAQALKDAKRERVLDDPSAYPLAMLSGLLGWLAEIPAPRCTLEQIDEIDADEEAQIETMHSHHLCEAMLSERCGGAAYELMDRFRRYGGKHWQAAVADAMDSIPDDVAASDVADAARDAAEIEETQASLMPGRV